MKLVLTAPAVFLLAVSISGSAYADPPLLGIIAGFCEEVLHEADDALEELDEASRDLRDCGREFDDCQSGLFNNDPVSCIISFTDCTDDANRDTNQACNLFSKKLGDAYVDALREARRHGPGVESRFQLWIQNRGEECLQPAVAVATACAAID